VKHHPAAPTGVRVAILAAVLSLVPGVPALARDLELVTAEPTSQVASASPDAIAPASAGPTASPSVAASPAASPAASGLVGAPDVTMRGSVFHPLTIEVKAGETVDWLNDDVTVHTVTARDGSLNSGVMLVGDAFSATFTTPGTIDYLCAIHPLMTGTVTVTE